MERKERLMEVQKDISFRKNESFINKKLSVLIERVEGEYFIGRSYRDAPEVDGEILVKNDGAGLQIGSFNTVEILNNDEYDLYGRLVKSRRVSK